MANETYTLIEKITVGAAGASSVTFTSIPQTYTDLVLKFSLRGTNYTGVFQNVGITFNGTSTNYSEREVRGNGSAASSASTSSAAEFVLDRYPTQNATANTFGNGELYIPNYTSANNKSVSSDSTMENNATESWMQLTGKLWSNTAAITSIGLRPSNGGGTDNFAQYSTFYLYGIAKEGVNPAPSSAPYATGGDRILFDGTYWYHAFTSTGTFTPKKGLSCDILVVAGGGGGGCDNGGGGGAGGLLAHSTQSLTTTGYTVTIGAGGAGASTYTVRGSSGSSSQFGSLTSSSGGGGGGTNFTGVQTGLSGGSGGGGAPGSTGGTGTSGQGNTGGSGGSSYSGGGGGGAGATGSNGSGNVGGAGGIGSSTYSSYGSATNTGQNVSGTYYFAGGGGGGTETNGSVGGTGGSGGGGTGGRVFSGGSSPINPTAGTANTGGGGGGGQGNSGAGAAGGSGIVIVRYAA